jgi:hypothetical protein
MSDEQQPDYGSTLVWSNDDKRNVAMLLEKNGGSVDAALKALFQAGNTSYQQALDLSTRFGPAFGMSATDFMKKYRLWRKGCL